MPFLPGDAAVFLADFGVSVVNPCGESTTGILRTADMEESGTIVRRTVLRVETGTAGTLVETDTDPDVELIVDGTRYRVDYTLQVDDGLFTDVFLGAVIT